MISIPFCDSPEKSVAAAVAAGLLGGAAGVALLAGALGGTGDFGLHVVRRDEQFRRVLGQLRG